MHVSNLEADLSERCGFNLGLISRVLHPHAVAAIEAGDLEGLLLTMGDKERLLFCSRNAAQLRERGWLEAALLSSYVLDKCPPERLCLDIFGRVALGGGWKRFRAAGPLPGPGPFKLYRGVNGRGGGRLVRGLSWTGSLDVACWFALWPSRAAAVDPAVYTVTLEAENVLAYTNERDEDEHLLLLSLIPWAKPERMRSLTPEMIAEAAGRRDDHTRQQWESLAQQPAK